MSKSNLLAPKPKRSISRRASRPKSLKDFKGNQGIHCPTKEELKAILRLNDDMSGLKHWSSPWNSPGKYTVYYPFDGSLGHLKDSAEKGGTVYPASDYLPVDFYLAPKAPEPKALGPDQKLYAFIMEHEKTSYFDGMVKLYGFMKLEGIV